jgi:hypothetical protein
MPEGIGLGASEAFAAASHIDGAGSHRPPEAALGLPVRGGGGPRVVLPTAGSVGTKGAAQVASLVNPRGQGSGGAGAGDGGPGPIAALERGGTGQSQVRALVRADLKAPVQVQGGMSREQVKRVIDRHLDEVTYCYETSLIEDPNLAGKVTFEWKILESGQVGEVRIQSSSIRSDSLHTCIKRRIKEWDFPKPKGAEVIVSYPFVLDVVGF